MAALIVQSRFAGLKIEDDDSSPTERIPKNKVKPTNDKKPESQKKTKTNAAKVQSTTRRKKAKQVQMSAEQWETWKQKDEQMVDGHYEDELQQAIILSKLDYEEKKDVYKQLKKTADKEKVQEEQGAKNKNKKQQKKKNVMSLDQFNVMMNGEDTKSNHDIEKDQDDNKSPVGDTEFFSRVKDETKSEVLKDKRRVEHNDSFRSRQMASDEVITRVQFLDALERKDLEITTLKLEVSGLKQELLTVKSRNKKLCNILGQGEMKDKAEVLVEVERLRGVQAELTAELAALHSDLERERSRHLDPRAKDKKSASKKKNIRFDVSSEAMLSKESSSGTAG